MLHSGDRAHHVEQSIRTAVQERIDDARGRGYAHEVGELRGVQTALESLSDDVAAALYEAVAQHIETPDTR